MMLHGYYILMEKEDNPKSDQEIDPKNAFIPHSIYVEKETLKQIDKAVKEAAQNGGAVF